MRMNSLNRYSLILMSHFIKAFVDFFYISFIFPVTKAPNKYINYNEIERIN